MHKCVCVPSVARNGCWISWSKSYKLGQHGDCAREPGLLHREPCLEKQQQKSSRPVSHGMRVLGMELGSSQSSH